VKKMGMERLSVAFYMNDVAKLSTIKTERGLSYPFARNYNFSLQMTF
jgi:Cu/Ag efflux protein CusF